MSPISSRGIRGRAALTALACLWAFLIPDTASAARNVAPRDACVVEAQNQFGDSWRRIDRRIERGASVVEFWITDADEIAATRVYCRYNTRTGAIEQVAMLEKGAFRPRG